MKKIFRIIAVASMAAVLSGCSTLGSNIENTPLVDPLSEKEVADYYAKALSYDTIASRSINVNKVSYETQPVDADTATKLSDITASVEDVLKHSSYNSSSDTTKLISESTYNYIKAFLNDKQLSNATITSTTEALGFYFVDVKYDVSEGPIGSFTDKISLLGLNGAFKQDSNNNDTVDTAFIRQAVYNLNKYYRENSIKRSAVFDENTLSLHVYGNDMPSLDFTETSLNSNGATANNSSSSVSRAPKIDTSEFNTRAGSSKGQSAYMPKLAQVYSVPAGGSNINGMGIYPCGSGGLSSFGFNRSQISGSMTLRYVYKQSGSDSSQITGFNIYPVSFELESGIGVNTDNVTVPKMLTKQFKILIDQSDRAIVDDDLAALMSGYLYSDAGMAVLSGYEANYANILRNMSTLRRVVARNSQNNAYLVEIETTRQEGSISSDTYGTYKDKYYAVIEQSGTNFIITDMILMSRQMVNEPSIDPDDSVTKQIAALNLAGNISDDAKKGIQALLLNLYSASSYRVLNGPKDITYNGSSIHVDTGMYDCFNSDTSILSSTDKEYINETLRELLVKYGTDVGATYSGVVTDWIGGSDDQAEITTEELINYDGKSTGTYLETYYLVSNVGGKWVIDDMQILKQEEVSGNELNQISDRVNVN